MILSLQNLAHTISMYLLISYCIYIAYIVPKCGRRRCRRGEGQVAARSQNGKARSGPRNLGSLPATRVPTIATTSQIFRRALDCNAQIHKNSCIRVLCSYALYIYIKQLFIMIRSTIFGACASPHNPQLLKGCRILKMQTMKRGKISMSRANK